MKASPPPAPVMPLTPLTPSTAALPAETAARLAHLFRDTAASGRTHELLPLLQRYRAGERG
jgi:hypothetical protein